MRTTYQVYVAIWPLVSARRLPQSQAMQPNFPEKLVLEMNARTCSHCMSATPQVNRFPTRKKPFSLSAATAIERSWPTSLQDLKERDLLFSGRKDCLARAQYYCMESTEYANQLVENGAYCEVVPPG